MPLPSHAPQLDRHLLRDGVYRHLRDAIIDGTLAPGERLRDVELAAWLKVSRTPVREALQRLAESGLVVTKPSSSTVVASVNMREVRDARNVVAAMHHMAVRDAVGRLTRADIAGMREANRRFSAAIKRQDVDAALRADEELHGVPVAVAANRALSTVLEQFGPIVRRVERLRFSSLGGRASVARHDELIRLCAEGDAEGAAQNAFDTWYSLPALDE